MSRSRRKTPVLGITTAKSEKQDKRIANRKLRRLVNQRLACDAHGVMPALREVSNVWSMAKDGKHWYFKRLWEEGRHRDPWWKLMMK